MIARLTAQPACDYDADRAEDLPTADENHPDHDPAWPDGYETPSTGFLQVGARDYDPDLGRWLQPDPQPTGPELQWGQNNRWAYCANDPVNSSDPTGRALGDRLNLFELGYVVGYASAVFRGMSQYSWLFTDHNTKAFNALGLAVLGLLFGALLKTLLFDIPPGCALSKNHPISSVVGFGMGYYVGAFAVELLMTLHDIHGTWDM